MARYFFDYVNESGTTHDYQGRDFGCLDGARQQGELIAIDLQLDQELEGPVLGRVAVRDILGKELISIPLQSIH